MSTVSDSSLGVAIESSTLLTGTRWWLLTGLFRYRGRYADLLLVEGNSLANIELLASNRRHNSHIMVDGRFMKRPRL
jgi:hypothetical protein